MVQRYNASTSVSVAPVARPQSSPLAEMAGGVRELAKTAQQEASRVLEEKTAALESAALNEARIELEKRGGELAIELQKDRVAGSNYVRDLEAARKPLKDEIWAKLPARVQQSQRARSMFDDFYTNDQIGATRAATAWQMGQERSYALNTLDKAMLSMTAKVEADPSLLTKELEGWKKSLPTYSGLLDQETIAKAETQGVQALLQGGVRGFAKQGKFAEAEALVTDAAAQLDPTQRRAFESVIEDAKNDIERERLKQEKERAESQRLEGNRAEMLILDGQLNRSGIDALVSSGKVSENDKPALVRALRAEDDRRRAEAEQARMSAAERKAMEERSEDMKFIFEAMADMSPSKFLTGPDGWSETEKKYYSLMTPADQRAVDRKLLDMQISGVTTTAAGSVYSALVDEAKRIVPEWQLSSDAKNLDQNSLPFRGVLRAAAEQIAQEKGGKPLTVDEARDAVARALRSYQPDKWMGLPTNDRDAWMDRAGAAAPYDEDANIRNEIRAEWIKAKGKPPTKAELDAEFARVVGE